MYAVGGRSAWQIYFDLCRLTAVGKYRIYLSRTGSAKSNNRDSKASSTSSRWLVVSMDPVGSNRRIAFTMPGIAR